MIGFPLTGLIVGLTGYICWSLYQLHLLSQWLQDPDNLEPPELKGIFEILLDSCLRGSRQNRREKQLLKASLVRQNRLIDGVKDAVLLIDDQDSVSWINKQAAEMFQLNESKAQGTPLGNIIRDPQFFGYITEKEYGEPLLMPSPTNRAHWLELSITEYEHGDKILILRDVTRMQHLEKMRTDFIGNLSHELRTPLTVLRGYIETLHLQPNLSDSTARIYGEMANQSQRMAQLLADLATLSKLESNEVLSDPAPVNVSALLHRTIADAQQLANFNGHLIVDNINPDLWLTAVENDLYSALSNLVFNAVRHTPAKTKIWVKATSNKQGLKIQIKDNGPGIDAKHLPRITERFYRVDVSRNSGTGGTGLGLAIVKHAINAQKGKLKIESTLGKGTSFTCTFPSSQLCSSPEVSDKEAV